MDSTQTIVDRPPWLFTSESAKILVKKAWEIRRERAKQQASLKETQAKQALKAIDSTDAFREQSATRTREQMQQIQTKIQEQLNKPVLDSKVLKELTEALARLETIEQKLSGRASPGALRPRSEKSSRSRPSEPEPMQEDCSQDQSETGA